MSDEASLAGRRVLLGVTGGIAAYKAADLVRRLREAGAEVRVVMTRGATEFVTPLTFQAVSGQPVHTELLDADAEAGMGHIELARWADVVLVAPATANFLAQLAQGRAEDLLSTVCVATRAPLFVAPAMNQGMWANEATRENVTRLEQRGVRVLGPGEGDQACGDTGPGRMLEPVELVAALGGARGGLAGRHVLVTAGPTHEDIDPVRFIGNRSSGKMGYAVAEAARRAGARVTLVSGPVVLAAPDGVDCVRVRSAAEMHAAVMEHVADADVFIGVAAVADWTPVRAADGKLKKEHGPPRIELQATPDIIAEVAGRSPRPYMVGFAAETDAVAEHAAAKRAAKGLDMIAANRVGEPGTGFGADDNELLLITREGPVELGKGSKRQLATELIARIAAQLPGDAAG